MPRATLSAALFDFDGTLVDTTELIYESLKHATRDVLGDSPPREVLMRGVGTPLPRQMEVLVADRDGLDAEERTRLARELLESYRHHNEAKHEDLIRDFPGVGEALARLRASGTKIAVVTSKRRRSVEMALASFPELREVTDRFVTMEDTNEHKPHPEPLLKGLELVGEVPREEAAYVGDSPHDVQAARAAGLTSVAVSWGAFTEEDLRAANPDHLVGDLDAAVDVLLAMREG
jgi:pyrophosphatase PpaX